MSYMAEIITLESGKMVHGTVGKWVMDGTELAYFAFLNSSASNYYFFYTIAYR